MKKRFLSMLVLLMAATGAWAQEPATYKITVAEGTEDAGNWNVPAEAAEGAEVTVTYNGTKKVKSVKAVKKEAIKPDLLSGVFSVSSTKKVNFSKGNLQATYDGSSWTWAFANNQWDYIGKAAGNTKVTEASPFISENGTVDYFGWVGASSTWDGVNQYGITSSNTRNATDGYGNSATENLKYDWGTLMGTGWRTLTKDEWDYMLNSRSGTRYCKAQVNSKSGLVIFPDGYSHPTGPTAPTNTNTTDAAYTTNSWSGEAWTKMENAGCVFLPAAGLRNGNSVSDAGADGYYWSSTHYEEGGDGVDRAYNLYFRNNYLSTAVGSYRDKGRSVRLVQAAPLTYPIALSAVTADYIGSVVTSDGNVYPAKTAVPAGKTAVGILGKVTETGHGLILALQNATDQEWNTINGWPSETNYAGTTLKVLPDDAARGSLTSYTTLGTTAVSNWAVAQKSDYEAIFQNLGSTTGNVEGKTYDDNVNAYITTGVGGTAISDRNWSLTMESEGYAYDFESLYWSVEELTVSLKVRPVLGF